MSRLRRCGAHSCFGASSQARFRFSGVSWGEAAPADEHRRATTNGDQPADLRRPRGLPAPHCLPRAPPMNAATRAWRGVGRRATRTVDFGGGACRVQRACTRSWELASWHGGSSAWPLAGWRGMADGRARSRAAVAQRPVRGGGGGGYQGCRLSSCGALGRVALLTQLGGCSTAAARDDVTPDGPDACTLPLPPNAHAHSAGRCAGEHERWLIHG